MRLCVSSCRATLTCNLTLSTSTGTRLYTCKHFAVACVLACVFLADVLETDWNVVFPQGLLQRQIHSSEGTGAALWHRESAQGEHLQRDSTSQVVLQSCVFPSCWILNDERIPCLTVHVPTEKTWRWSSSCSVRTLWASTIRAEMDTQVVLDISLNLHHVCS